jgi:hypothetical protein
LLGDLRFQFVERRARERKRYDRVDNTLPFRLFSIRRTSWHCIGHDLLYVPTGRRELTANDNPDRVELLAQHLATLVSAQQAGVLRRISVMQIGQRADNQLGGNALLEIGAASNLAGDGKLLQGRLQWQTDGANAIQNGDPLRGAALAHQPGDRQRHLPRLYLRCGVIP